MANHITEMRKKAGFKNVEDLAKVLECSRHTIYAIEEDKRKPGTVLGFKLAKVLKCELEDIFLPYYSTVSAG